MKKEIIPAIIAKTQGEMEERIAYVQDAANILQLDVMDGLFVPNESLNFDLNVPENGCIYEAHLMVDDPIAWIRQNGEKVDLILAPIESSKDPQRVIDEIKKIKKKAGFVLNPETPLSTIDSYLPQLDEVLIMSVNPGFYGSPFLPETMEKIRELRQIAPELDIEVDGGITDQTIGKAYVAGANLFVSGSYIVKNTYPKQAVENLQKLISAPLE